MKFRYYRDTGSLYVELSVRPGVDSREAAPGVVLDFDEAGHLVGIDIDDVRETVGEDVVASRSGGLEGVRPGEVVGKVGRGKAERRR